MVDLSEIVLAGELNKKDMIAYQKAKELNDLKESAKEKILDWMYNKERLSKKERSKIKRKSKEENNA